MAGFRVQSANRYTIGPAVTRIRATHVIALLAIYIISLKFKANDGDRTRDLLLTKQTLYH